jgi:hypothetical protein
MKLFEIFMYREVLAFVDRFTAHSSAVHGEWCTASCEAHANIANESVCLMASNIWN